MFLLWSHPPQCAWLCSQWGVCSSAAGRADLICGVMGGLLSWAFFCGSSGGDAQLSASAGMEINQQTEGTPGTENSLLQRFSQKLFRGKQKMFEALCTRMTKLRKKKPSLSFFFSFTHRAPTTGVQQMFPDTF